ncbi:MAG: MarR family transcriptional regulator, partial [Candidatus Obscuribacterales bacterium]|nr:MarR family transcriptional regulator [Candidatus Obscuribacterales bacterium]
MMDYLSQLGSLALGSRLKRLSERLNLEVAAIYQQKEFSFEPRWFPVFHFLGQNGENAITDIARAIDVTHPAVNQVASEMLSAGIIVQVASASDKRRRLLSLSKKGQKIFDEMESSWRLIRMSINQAIEESSHDIVTAIQSLEQSLDKADLPSRFAQNEELLKNATVEIIEFDPAYRDDFRLLNE